MSHHWLKRGLNCCTQLKVEKEKTCPAFCGLKEQERKLLFFWWLKHTGIRSFEFPAQKAGQIAEPNAQVFSD
jgi:hypothetical protein